MQAQDSTTTTLLLDHHRYVAAAFCVHMVVLRHWPYNTYIISDADRCVLLLVQAARPERQLRAGAGRSSMAAAPGATATAGIEKEQMVQDGIEGSLLRPDVDDPKRSGRTQQLACCVSSQNLLLTLGRLFCCGMG